MEKIDINPQKLYQGCLFAAIIHAILVGEYPELNYEHSWDGLNYSMNDSQGCRGTITFHPQCIVAVFRDDARILSDKGAYDYLCGMPEDILKIAQAEALQYVLDDVDGEVKPVITAAFWGTWEELSSSQTWSDIWENGGHILENQLLPHRQSFIRWDEYYGLSDGQMKLAQSLFDRKLAGAEAPVSLSEEEAENLHGDIEECAVSLRELNIFLPAQEIRLKLREGRD